MQLLFFDLNLANKRDIMETSSILKPPRFPKKKYAVLAENLCKAYTDRVPVLNNFSMHVEEGIV